MIKHQKIVAYKYVSKIRKDVMLTNHMFHIYDDTARLGSKYGVDFGFFLWIDETKRMPIKKELKLKDGFSKGYYYKLETNEVDYIKVVLRKYGYTIIVIDWGGLMQTWLMERL